MTEQTAHSLTSPLANTAAWVYGMVGSLRNFFFDAQIFSSYRAKLPVICVGNITVGGSGKTPLVRYIVDQLRLLGESPVVLSRGYGGTHRGPYLVQATDSAADVGDEPKMFSLDTTLPIVIAHSRSLGAQFIEQKKLGSVIILGDGFQHRWLARDLNLVCVNIADDRAVEQFRSGKLLPAGIFRERRAEALRRATALVFSSRKADAPQFERSPLRELRSELPVGLPCFTTQLHAPRIVNYNGQELEKQPVALACAIANPEGFLATVESLGFVIEKRSMLRDHSPQVQQVVEDLLAMTPLSVVITEKDMVKLSEETQRNQRVYHVDFSLSLQPKEEFNKLLAAAVQLESK